MDKERMVSKMMNSVIGLKECGLPMDDSLRGLRRSEERRVGKECL